MTDLDYFRRRLADLIVAGNRLQIDMPGDDSRVMSDALNSLIQADALVEKLEHGRQARVFGGGS